MQLAHTTRENHNQPMNTSFTKLLIKVGFTFVLLSFLSSCVPYTSLVNYDEQPTIPTTPQAISNYQPLLIKPNDILHISITSSEESAVAQPFERSGGNTGAMAANGIALLLSGYLVNPEGYIDFPTLGKIKLDSLSIDQAKIKFSQLLKPYFEVDPIITMRLINFRVSVNGEVKNPGTFDILNERITVIEAISMAGDFTDYARRDSILVIRETKVERTFGYVDFNSSDLFNSPFFYLQQNDVIYIRPERRKIGVVRDPGLRILTWVSALTGTAALIISLTGIN